MEKQLILKTNNGSKSYVSMSAVIKAFNKALELGNQPALIIRFEADDVDLMNGFESREEVLYSNSNKLIEGYFVVEDSRHSKIFDNLNKAFEYYWERYNAQESYLELSQCVREDTTPKPSYHSIILDEFK